MSSISSLLGSDFATQSLIAQAGGGANPLGASPVVAPSEGSIPLQTIDNLFGTSDAASGTAAASSSIAPMLQTPPNLIGAAGLSEVLGGVLPTSGVPSPFELLRAQVQLVETQLGWQFTAKLAGTSVTGIQTLLNSQV